MPRHRFLGTTGRGSAEVTGRAEKIDIITGTLGKALGGALGYFTTAKREVIEMLRQRSRPIFFQLAAAARRRRGIEVFDMPDAAGELRKAGGEHRVLPREDDRRRRAT